MAEADFVPCRLCTHPVARDATTCPACGTKFPGVNDEPTWNPRLLRWAGWVGCVVLLILVLLVFGLFLFRPWEPDGDRLDSIHDSQVERV